MAFLIPENIPSRGDVHPQLRSVATTLRDTVDDEVTVWLEEGEDRQFLLVLDPAAGIILIDAPPTDLRRRRGALFQAPDSPFLQHSVRLREQELSQKIQIETRLAHMPTTVALAFPGLQADEARHMIVGNAPILDEFDFGDRRLRRALARVLGQEELGSLGEVEERAVRGVINPEIIISGKAFEESPGQLVFRPPDIGAEDVIRVLDRQQEALARHLGTGYRVIRGVAGSGKTLVLMFRARFLAENFPQWRILVTCYNRVLARALEEQLNDMPNVAVHTIDSVAWQVAGKSKQVDNQSGWDELRERALERITNGVVAEPYDVVLVDEAQDFDTTQLQIAFGMLKPGSDGFVVALDNAQNIYRKRSRWNPPGMTAQGRTTLMRTNYRNTKEILEFAFSFLTGGRRVSADEVTSEDPDVIVPPEATSRRGPAPRLLSCRGRDDEVSAIADAVIELNRQGVPWGSIAVIFGAPQWQTALYFEFKARGIPYHWVSKNMSSKDQIMRVGNVVRSSTVQSLKGLEFSRVFVCGANQFQTEDNDVEAVKRLLYVAMTRAVDELTITVSGDGPITAALQAAATTLRRLGPTVGLTQHATSTRTQSRTVCDAPGCSRAVSSGRLCDQHPPPRTGPDRETRGIGTAQVIEVAARSRAVKDGRQECPQCKEDYPARWERCGHCNAPNPHA